MTMAEAVFRRYGIKYVKREYADAMVFPAPKPLYTGRD
jgi:hypothetical protein